MCVNVLLGGRLLKAIYYAQRYDTRSSVQAFFSATAEAETPSVVSIASSVSSPPFSDTTLLGSALPRLLSGVESEWDSVI